MSPGCPQGLQCSAMVGCGVRGRSLILWAARWRVGDFPRGGRRAAVAPGSGGRVSRVVQVRGCSREASADLGKEELNLSVQAGSPFGSRRASSGRDQAPGHAGGQAATLGVPHREYGGGRVRRPVLQSSPMSSWIYAWKARAAGHLCRRACP